MYCYTLIVLLFVTKSHQFPSEGKGGNNCSCQNQCRNKFTTNSVNDEQTISACGRGCRFHSLVLHTSNDLNPVVNYGLAQEACMISCSESYFNHIEMGACHFGCSSLKPTDSCDIMEHHLPQNTYSVVVEESVLIHPDDPDPDDALIDPGLGKQIEKTLETLLNSKTKLPEIHFRNLPVNKAIVIEFPRTTFKCPKFYGFDTKFEFRNSRVTTSDLFFLFSVLVFALICFLVSRNLGKQRKMCRQLLMNIIQHKSNTMKTCDTSIKDETPIKCLIPENEDISEVKCVPADLNWG